MTWRTFGQVILLIASFFLAYWLLLEVRDREIWREERATSSAVMNAANANLAAAEENLKRVQSGDYTLMSNDITAIDGAPARRPGSRKQDGPMDNDDEYSLANAIGANDSGE